MKDAEQNISREDIIRAPEETARAILAALCADGDTYLKAIACYNKLEKPAHVDTSGPISGFKRKRVESEIPKMICTHCEEAFTEAENHMKACLYHTGMTYPRVWPDEFD